MAWDPTRPSVLYVTAAADNKDASNHTTTTNACLLHRILAHAGTGCNDHELTALLMLLSAHDEFQNRRHDEKATNNSTMADVLGLFRAYREAVTACLSEWSERLRTTVDDTDDASPEVSSDQDIINIELLRVNYAVLQISHVFLPLLPSRVVDGRWEKVGVFYQEEDPYAIPGRATADAVRYVRYNHISEVQDEDSAVTQMLDVPQPDMYNERLYWETVTKHVLRGCLEQAWTCLAKHSLYVAAISVTENADATTTVDPQYAAQMLEIKHGFEKVRDIMLLAPLPAGRSDVRDNDLHGIVEDDDDDYYVADDDCFLTSTDYRLWEPQDAGAAGDMPLDFQAGAAKRKHQQWQQYVEDFQRSRPGFLNRIPELKAVLAILTGDLTNAPLPTWADQLLAVLLYKSPDMTPLQLSRRAKRIVNGECSTAHTVPLVNAFLDIMEGNAGQAVSLMFHYGGASGAALPTTLVRSILLRKFALLCYEVMITMVYVSIFQFCAVSPAL
jgi:hypothetical protein